VFVLLQIHADNPLSELQYDKNAYKILCKADSFSTSGTGYGGDMSQETEAYAKLYKSKDAKEVFVQLEKNSNMQGKLYALSALYFFDKERYDLLVQEYMDSDKTVRIMAGCILGSYPLSEIIKAENGNNDFGADFYSGKFPEQLNSYITSASSETSDLSTESESLPEQFKYDIQAQIHANMPEYRFVASGEDVFVTGLDVYNEKGLSILSVSFEPESCPVYLEMMDTMGLHATDVNFDGYKDVIILNCFHGAHGNSWYDCWLWDAKTSSYIHSKSFVEICNPALDRDKQCIYSTGGSGATNQGWYIYKFIGGEFVVTNKLSFEFLQEESGGLQVTEEALKNGKMEVVHKDVIYGDVSFYETSYNDDKLWLLNNPRWYGIGGHQADKWLE
jgi:hypothetical protein